MMMNNPILPGRSKIVKVTLEVEMPREIAEDTDEGRKRMLIAHVVRSELSIRARENAAALVYEIRDKE